MKHRVSRALSLRARFTLGLAAVLLPFLLQSVVSLGYLLPRLVDPHEQILWELESEMEAVMDLQRELLVAAMPPNDYLIDADPEERVLYAQARARVDELFEAMTAERFTLAEEHRLVEAARGEWVLARRLAEELLALPRPVGDPAAAALMRRFDTHIFQAVALLGELDTSFHHVIDRNQASLHAAYALGKRLIIGAFLLGLAVSLYAGVWLMRSVLIPVRRLEGAAVRFGAGDLNHRAETGTDDELGRLAETFNAMAEALMLKRSALEARSAQLGALNWIAIALTSSFLNLKALLDQIMRSGIELTGASAACIALYDEARGSFTEQVTQGLSEHFVRGMSFRPGGLAEEVFAAGTHIVSNDRRETRYRLSDLARGEGLRCFICLPLKSRERRLGVIYFYRTDRDTFTPDEIGLLTTFAALAAGTIDNMHLYAQAQEQARTDVLTGLDNRRAFLLRLDDEIGRARRHGRAFSLLLIDLDHFKAINDTYGHPAGDEVLRELAARVRAAVRPTDHAGRYGGEEFTVILPETTAAGARVLAERVRDAVAARPFDLSGGRAPVVTVSVGVASWPDDSDDPRQLVERADQALYAAKAAGRNRVVLYRETLKAEIERNPARVVSLLNEGLDNIGPLIAAAASKADFFHGHMEAVERAATWLAVELKLPEADTATLALAARLHDLGMVALPDAVLSGASPLTHEECAELRKHPAIAAAWLEQVPALRQLAPIVRHHHERWDGSGYPDGLRGDEIPYLARVLALADGYAAMSVDWPGHGAKSPEAIDAELRAAAGTQFDPALVAALFAAPKPPASV